MNAARAERVETSLTGSPCYVGLAAAFRGIYSVQRSPLIYHLRDGPPSNGEFSCMDPVNEVLGIQGIETATTAFGLRVHQEWQWFSG